MTMSNDKILSVEDIRGTLKKMKEGVKKQPGLMKSTYRYLDAVSGYVDRIANARMRASGWRPTAPSSPSRFSRRWT
jgi:hypothetical protein